jgi:hypothetical protein
VTSTRHVPNRTDTGRSSGRCEAVRFGEGTSRKGARVARRWGQSRCRTIPGSAQALIERHDGTRPAHARRRLTRGAEWGLGSRRLTRRVSAQVDARRRKLPFGIGPERAVPARMTRDARGRERPSEAPPATWRGGSASAPESEAARPRDRTRATGDGDESRRTARCIGIQQLTAEAGALYLAPPPTGPPARTAWTSQSLSSNCGIASPRTAAIAELTSRDEEARSKR